MSPALALLMQSKNYSKSHYLVFTHLPSQEIMLNNRMCKSTDKNVEKASYCNSLCKPKI